MSGGLSLHEKAVMSLAASDEQLGFSCPLCGARSWTCCHDGRDEFFTGVLCLRCGFFARIVDTAISRWVSRYKVAKGIEQSEKEIVDSAVEVKAEPEKESEHGDESPDYKLPEQGRAKSAFSRLFNL